jgi:hypothetical protein
MKNHNYKKQKCYKQAQEFKRRKYNMSKKELIEQMKDFSDGIRGDDIESIVNGLHFFTKILTIPYNINFRFEDFTEEEIKEMENCNK